MVITVADPGSGAFLTLGSGIRDGSRSGSRINIPDHIAESLETNFWVKILQFFDRDPGSGNLFYPGSGIGDGKNILDPQH
jgi:hypothetical protein